MNYTPDFGWYYVNADDRAPAWSGVDFLYDFLTGAPTFIEKNGGIGPFAVEIPREQAALGDVVQYANTAGDWYHTVIVTGFDGEEILVSAQSDDALDRPLSSYRNAVTKRFLHIAGVRISINDDQCFETLINGGDMALTDPPDMADGV